MTRHSRLTGLLHSVGQHPGQGPGDGPLMQRFVASGDPRAFETLVRRHGVMVYGVCRQMLRDVQEAEDAFQATFLVLFQKAGRVRPPDRVGHWLYGVAVRVGRKARGRRARWVDRHPPLTAETAAEEAPARADGDDAASVLHEEIASLPRKYREPVVLCYLQGKKYDEAAAQLGCPGGTVATRLRAARERLRHRLSRRGVTAPAAALAGLLAGARAEAAPGLVGRTVALVGELAAARPVLSGVVAELVRETLRESARQWATRVAAGALLVLAAAGGIAAGVGGRADPPAAPARAADRPDPAVPADDLLFAAAPWEGKGPAADPADGPGFEGVPPRDPKKPASGTTPWGVRWNFDPATGTVTVDGTRRDDSLYPSRDKDGTLVVNHRRDWTVGRSARSGATDTGVPLGPGLTIVLNGGGGHDRIATYLLKQTTDFRRLTVDGGAGNDELIQWGPLDLERVAAGDVVLSGGDGNDTIRAHGSRVTAGGGPGVDQIIFDAPNISRVHGGGDQDVFYLYALPPGGPGEDAFYIKQLPDFDPARKDVFGILNRRAF